MNRVLGAALGFVLGVLIASTGFPAAAQGDQLPFASGDTITLHYDRAVSCRVIAVRGEFVRCAVDDKTLTWWNLHAVTRIETTVVR